MQKYWIDLGERVGSSFAGGFLSIIGLDGVNVLHLDWKAALGVGAGAALVSLLKGFLAKGLGRTTASLSSKV
jgi:hypothetical protein